MSSMMSSIADANPPGVSTSKTTALAPSSAARAIAPSMNRAIGGVIVPSTRTRSTRLPAWPSTPPVRWMPMPSKSTSAWQRTRTGRSPRGGEVGRRAIAVLLSKFDYVEKVYLNRRGMDLAFSGSGAERRRRPA
jgi:hypothetical protein